MDFMEEEMEIPIKVLIVGNGAVGKSSMMRRYCKGVYTNDYKKTIGVDFLEKKKIVSGQEVRLMIWDTAGQEEFGKLTRSYYLGAHACVVAFSTTDRASFEAVKGWIEKVEEVVQDIPMVLVQNKIDQIDKAVMTKEEAEALAAEVRLKFYKTSVQENISVDDVFQYLSEQYLAKIEREKAAAAGSARGAAFGDTGGGTANGSAAGRGTKKPQTAAKSDGKIRLGAMPKKGKKKRKGCKFS